MSDRREAVKILKRINLHRAALQRLYNRAAGQHHDTAADGIDDALAYLSFAADAVQYDLDQASKG